MKEKDGDVTKSHRHFLLCDIPTFPKDVATKFIVATFNFLLIHKRKCLIRIFTNQVSVEKPTILCTMAQRRTKDDLKLLLFVYV